MVHAAELEHVSAQIMGDLLEEGAILHSSLIRAVARAVAKRFIENRSRIGRLERKLEDLQDEVSRLTSKVASQ
ncbi:MAG: hypothetical protein K0U16_07165 [Gammaproteobacteria bacterium]|nr:hypothetical protein [Gammaproteobacteria bacterium]